MGNTFTLISILCLMDTYTQKSIGLYQFSIFRTRITGESITSRDLLVRSSLLKPSNSSGYYYPYRNIFFCTSLQHCWGLWRQTFSAIICKVYTDMQDCDQHRAWRSYNMYYNMYTKKTHKASNAQQRIRDHHHYPVSVAVLSPCWIRSSRRIHGELQSQRNWDTLSIILVWYTV